MVISPPFLPLPLAGETEAQWFARAMNPQAAKAAGVDASEGSFPVSALFMWHNGIHLMAPPAPGGVLPVRAMADGKVIYFREPTKFTTDATHPQNCSPNNTGPCWTDNGCVILEHNTDIGTAGEVATGFVYYSLTMHLAALDPAVKLNARIYRKDIVGRAGNIYGRTADIHLEICCDDVQIKRLIGRDPLWAPPFNRPAPRSDGRTDAVFGDLFIYLPATTHLAMRIGEAPTRTRLRRAICKFPTEWDGSTFEARHRWMLDPEKNAHAGTKEQWAEFLRYGAAMCLPNLPAAYLNAQWRFHPVEFIDVMRQVGWMSKDEFFQCIPRYPNYNLAIQPAVALTQGVSNTIAGANASARMSPYLNSFNRVARKYSINSGRRLTHFLAQVILETARWGQTVSPMIHRMEEWYFGQPQKNNPMVQYYSAFYGRGVMQLTWAGNYAEYGRFRSIPSHSGPYVEKLTPDSQESQNHLCTGRPIRLLITAKKFNGHQGMTRIFLRPMPTVPAIPADFTGCQNIMVVILILIGNAMKELTSRLCFVLASWLTVVETVGLNVKPMLRILIKYWGMVPKIRL